MKHETQRQGDELFCKKCGRRWGIDDAAPECDDSVLTTPPPIARLAEHIRQTNIKPFIKRKGSR